MKPPRCRLCHVEHWSYDPHVFRDDVETPKRVATVVANTVANTVAVANGVAKKVSVRYQKWREANPELYKQRQRELMRRRRGG